ncbi:MAG: hypothetical protein U1E53_21020 [Dongiaceae bacterium]
MRKTLLIAAAGLVASLGAAAPALADHDNCYNCGQDYYGPGANRQDQRWDQDRDRNRGDWRRRLMPAGMVADQLRQQRFRHIDFAGRDGDIYRYTAVDPRGREVRLAVDAHNGRIVNMWRR